jgi:hypothetical protein
MLRELVRSYYGYRVERLEIWHRLNWGSIFIRREIFTGNPHQGDFLSRSFLKKRSKLFSHTCAAEQCSHTPCRVAGKKIKEKPFGD